MKKKEDFQFINGCILFITKVVKYYAKKFMSVKKKIGNRLR